jgi:hypothetical protein
LGSRQANKALPPKASLDHEVVESCFKRRPTSSLFFFAELSPESVSRLRDIEPSIFTHHWPRIAFYYTFLPQLLSVNNRFSIMRLSAIFSFLCATVALILSLLLLFAGSTKSFLQHGDLLTVSDVFLHTLSECLINDGTRSTSLA